MKLFLLFVNHAMDEPPDSAPKRAAIPAADGPVPDWLPPRSAYEHLRFIGVLGGVASGKSTAARILEDDGCLRLDADALARQRLEEVEIRPDLIAMFGPDVISPQNEVDRQVIAAAVFRDEGLRQRLERLIHPEVRARMIAALDQAEHDAAGQALLCPVVLDVPLLVESGWIHLCDHVLFLDTPTAAREARAQRDREWSAGEVLRREASQVPLEVKRQLAERIFKNEDVAHLRTELGAWLRDLRSS